MGHLKVIAPKRDNTCRRITLKSPPLSGVISHEPKHETTLRMELWLYHHPILIVPSNQSIGLISPLT